MLTVELDIYSGRPNPFWTLTDKQEEDILERLSAHRELVRPVDATVPGLGYRGYLITTLSQESVSEQRGRKNVLPSRFRIGGGAGADADAPLWLLETADQRDSEVDADLHDTTRQSILELQDALPQEEPADGPHSRGAFMRCSANYLTGTTSNHFLFWNTCPTMVQNNCYNFGANWRSNTFAQPGKMAGQMYRGYDPSSLRRALNADGWSERCVSGSNITSCLFIWPGRDYHFYRLCGPDRWCHKPGQQPARNDDNSGQFISDPTRCNRGDYTQFGGYQYANKFVQVR